MIGCSKEKSPASGQGSVAQSKKACFITNGALGNDFINLIWSGFKDLEKDGWEVKIIEATDASEYPEDIRAMAAEGYKVIMCWNDDVNTVALDLADEIAKMYPDVHMFLLDTYRAQDKDNCTAVAVDPYESSFVAGYVAAKMTKTGTIGWIGHTDVPKVRRFRDGYVVGANYANPNVKVVSSFVGASRDPTKGYEAGTALIKNNPVDIIYQACYLSGTGVIAACADAGIKCIGVDDWQGGIDPCVFWSAIKPINVAVKILAEEYEKGAKLGHFMNFDLASGGTVYDQRDLPNLPPELQNEVKQLIADIQSGKVDVYKGYENFRIDNYIKTIR